MELTFIVDVVPDLGDDVDIVELTVDVDVLLDSGDDVDEVSDVEEDFDAVERMIKV